MAGNTEIEHVVGCCLQSKGDVGKSTFIQLAYDWAVQREVRVQGFDLDLDQRSFARPHGNVKTVAIHNREDAERLLPVFSAGLKRELTLIDPRAHMRDIQLDALVKLDWLEKAAAHGLRLVVFLFPRDNVDVLGELHWLVQRLGSRVYYVVVMNFGVCHNFSMYHGGGLDAELQKLPHRVISIPRLESLVKLELARAEATAKRALRFDEAVAKWSELGIQMVYAGILELWLKGVYAKFDGIAEILMPKSRFEIFQAAMAKRETKAGAESIAPYDPHQWAGACNLEALGE